MTADTRPKTQQRQHFTKGKQHMATVFKRGGKRNRNGTYYVSWTDHNGKRHTKSARTTDKATAERIARKYESDAALRRDGVIDPTADSIGKESQKTVKSHLADYENKMRVAKRDPQYISETVGYIRRICKSFRSVGDINADAVVRFARQLKDDGRSSRTIEAYLTAVKGFTKWLSENDKLLRDPLTSVKKPDPKADRRLERRILAPVEWQWLAAVTASRPVRYGMTGTERALLYETAIQTGLRAGELRSLTRRRLFLDDNPPYVTCKAGSTKNKKLARQYIRHETALALRNHIATKAPGACVFGLPSEYDMADMVREDLAAARKSWLADAKQDPDEFLRREQDDFLAAVNHDGAPLAQLAEQLTLNQ